MKKRNLYNVLKQCALFFVIIIIFANCDNEQNNIADCDGYTGEVTNKSAKTLIAKCHFIPKDSIDSWTIRYKNNKQSIGSVNLEAANIMSDSCSFNNSIVRAIITNDSCIGLRVINGMDASNKVHVMLVGIKPDYSTLYIKRPTSCDITDTLNKNTNKNDGEPDDDLGGGEMAQNP